MQAIRQTKSPGRYVVLYDGHCVFCTRQSKKLTAIARPGAVVAIDFQVPGVLDHFPGITHDACMQAMHLVTPEGRVFKGFEAIVRAVSTRRVLGWIVYAYYVPGLRQLCDRLYQFVASRRYRLWGKAQEESCQGGECSVHFQQSRQLDD